MSKIIERIKEAYHLETDAEVADFLGIKPSTLSMQKNRRHLNLERIIKKCSDLNKSWLLEGQGPMMKSELVYETDQIPIYSDVNIGENNEPDFDSSNEEGKIMLDTSEHWSDVFSPDHLIGYTIPENVMAPTIQKHDIAFFNTNVQTPDEEAICLISRNDDIICRRIRADNDKYIISCDNAEHEVKEISKNNDDYSIIGKIVWVLRRIE